MKKRIAKLTFLLMILTVFSAMIAFGKNEQVTTGEDGVTRIYDAKGKLITNKPAYEVKTGKKAQYYGIDKDGVATLYQGTEMQAARQLCLIGAGSKKSTGNLKKAFKWAADMKYLNNTRKLKGDAAAKYYGNYAFTEGRGDCNTVAYAFYWMAKVLGYPAECVQGYVPNGSISNLQSHAWVTIKFGKKLFVFDPDFNRVYRSRFGKNAGWKIKYGQKNTYKYFSPKKKEIKK